MQMQAQNTDKQNTEKHPSDEWYSPAKGFILWEDFETATMPPTGWQLVSGTTSETWDTASHDPFAGNYYAQCLYDDNLTATQNEFLITPVFDLQTFSTAQLTFYFQFSQYWGINPNDNYDLYILASTDSAQTFSDTLWSELNTDTSSWTSFEWVFGQVDLAFYIGQPKFALAFVYHGFDGAEAALDDISIQTTGGLGEYSAPVTVFPNPSADFIRVDVSQKGLVSLTDLSGRVVYESAYEPGSTIAVDAYEPGMYSLQFRSGSIVRRALVEIR